jgi:DNA-binding IclR family transcriptional regulator
MSGKKLDPNNSQILAHIARSERGIKRQALARHTGYAIGTVGAAITHLKREGMIVEDEAGLLRASPGLRFVDATVIVAVMGQDGLVEYNYGGE